jgi:hypothetical protein
VGETCRVQQAWEEGMRIIEDLICILPFVCEFIAGCILINRYLDRKFGKRQ